MEKVGLVVAFLAGVGSFFTPCIFPLIPAYVSFITGFSLEEIRADKVRKWKDVLLPTLFFIAGFSTVFVTLGISAGFLGGVLFRWRPYLQFFGGIVVILFALQLMGVPVLPFLMREKRLHLERTYPRLIGPLIIGGAFAFGWSPCVGPILGSILTYAATGQDPTKAAFLLAIYSLGLGLPFLAVSLTMEAFLRLFSRMARAVKWATLLSGGVLIVIGVWMIAGGLRGGLIG